MQWKNRRVANMWLCETLKNRTKKREGEMEEDGGYLGWGVGGCPCEGDPSASQCYECVVNALLFSLFFSTFLLSFLPPSSRFPLFVSSFPPVFIFCCVELKGHKALQNPIFPNRGCNRFSWAPHGSHQLKQSNPLITNAPLLYLARPKFSCMINC